LIGVLDPQLEDIINTLVTSGPAVDDINSVANNAAVGIGIPRYTIDEHHNRSSIRDHLLYVKERHGKLHFALDTLATKVLLCENELEGSPTAYGVEIAPGAALAVASNFNGKHHLRTRTITVRHEVIISAGVFQSPQLVCV
jgi:choline dehydrogenase